MSSSVNSTVKKDSNKGRDYKVLGILGEGAFGKVGKCIHRKTKEIVALKVMKKPMEQSVKREYKMMNYLRDLDPDTFNIVRFIEHFEHNERRCMAYEMLDLSVHDFVRRYQVNSFSLNKVRPMAKQLLVALEGLHRLGIMHTDIKPDNIMLVDHEKQPFKVKLIDFGLARHYYEVRIGQVMQPISYRAPEVTLGLPLSEAVDMWSLGCCLAKWFLGSHPFVGKSPYDNLSKIIHFMGAPEDELLTKALYADDFFAKAGSQWRLKTLQEYKVTTGNSPELCETFLTVAQDLEDLIKNFKERWPFPEYDDRSAFFDLLRKMFELNPKKRITPSEALRHPFITMDHLPADDGYTDVAHDYMSVASTQIPPFELSLNLNITLTDKKQDKSPGEVPAGIAKGYSNSCASREGAIGKNEAANEDAASQPTGETASNRPENPRSQNHQIQDTNNVASATAKENSTSCASQEDDICQPAYQEHANKTANTTKSPDEISESLDETPKRSSGHLSDTSESDNENKPETITRSPCEISMSCIFTANLSASESANEDAVSLRSGETADNALINPSVQDEERKCPEENNNSNSTDLPSMASEREEMLTPSNDEQGADAINEEQREEGMTCASDMMVIQTSGPSDVDDTNHHQHIQVEPDTALESLTNLEALKEDCSKELPLDCSDLLKETYESCTQFQSIDSTEANTKKTKNAIWSFLGRLVPQSVCVLVERLFKSMKTPPNKPIFRKPKWANFVQVITKGFPKPGPSRT